jgi:sulfate transport system permease protein
VLALCFVTLPFVIRTVQPVLIELDVEMEEAARSLGAGQITVFRRIVLPNILPGILSGSVLALARALGEIGSLVLIAGTTLPTQVTSVQIFNLIGDGQSAQASALAVVLLGAAFVLLLAVGALRFYATRYERA